MNEPYVHSGVVTLHCPISIYDNSYVQWVGFKIKSKAWEKKKKKSFEKWTSVGVILIANEIVSR